MPALLALLKGMAAADPLLHSTINCCSVAAPVVTSVALKSGGALPKGAIEPSACSSVPVLAPHAPAGSELASKEPVFS